MSQKDVLMQRVAALEAKLGTDSKGSSRHSLVAEIESLGKRLGCYMDDAPVVYQEPSLDQLEQDLGMSDAMCASLADPSGIEEQITQDKFSQVEGERHGEELASAGSMLEVGREVGRKTVASEDYVTRLVRASARLDRVAEYLEKNGRHSLAFKVDRIADAVDAKINNINGRK